MLEAEKIPPKDTSTLISITDPEIQPNISYQKWRYHIRLKFEDVSNSEDGVIFSESMALRLINFVVSIPETVNLIVIHCVVGIARSGAVTKFITKYLLKDCFNPDFDLGYYAYNRTVYKTLVKVWKKIKKANKENTTD